MAKGEFYDMFVEQLRDIYDAEKQLVVALPKMAEGSTTPELEAAFTKHLKETKNQVERLNKVFKILNEDPEGVTCKATEGMIEECEETLEEYPKSVIRDAALIGLGQRVEHYEMAVYGTLRTFAKQLDLEEVADLLQENLDEEGAANDKLTDVAEGGFFSAGVNQKAANNEL